MFPNPFLNFPLYSPNSSKNIPSQPNNTPLSTTRINSPSNQQYPDISLGERHYYPKSSKPQSTTYQPKNHHTPPINIYSPSNQQCPDISLGERQLLSKIFKKPIKNRKVNIHQTPRYHLFSILVSLINKLIPK